jgi:hypothetical protein
VFAVCSPTVEDYSDLTQLVHDLPLMLKLIDWGQAIDLRCFPANTTFTAKVTTSGFQCVEMMTNRPWTYQVRYLIIAETSVEERWIDYWLLLQVTSCYDSLVM